MTVKPKAISAPVKTRSKNTSHKHSDLALRLIAIFKLVKGFLLLAAGIGALSLLHRDVAGVVSHWITLLHFDPDNHYFNTLLARLSLANDHRLEEIGAGSFFYAALLSTEGVGLLLKKRWAEYFTIIMTSSFIPLEVFEIVKRVTIAKLIVLAINAAIVWYLIARLRRELASAENHK